MNKLDAIAKVEIASLTKWRQWLAKNHSTPDSVWAVTWKKGSGKPHVPAAEISMEALCWGWVDSLPRKLDDQRSMLLVSPRKPKSAWSKLNKDRAAALIAEGRMQPAGFKVIDQAKATGQWAKLDKVEELSVPKDLGAAIRKHAGAAANFEAFPRSAKRTILEWIEQAKTPETRAKRVLDTAVKAVQNIRANQWKK